MKKLEKRASMLTMIIQQEYKKNHRVIKIDEIQNAVYHFGNFYIVLHDKDTAEDGTPKTPHYHVVIKSSVARQLKTVMKETCSALKIPEELVSIAPVNDLQQNLRYLVHADDKNKYQYKWENVWSNDFRTLEDAQTYVANLDTNTLIQICSEEETKLGVMRRIGLANFKKYLSVINNIYEYCREEARKSVVNEIEKQYLKAFGYGCLTLEEQAKRDLEAIMRLEKELKQEKAKVDDGKPFPTKEPPEPLSKTGVFKDGKLTLGDVKEIIEKEKENEQK